MLVRNWCLSLLWRRNSDLEMFLGGVMFGGVLESVRRPVKRSTELFWRMSYEKPVYTGWSI